MRKSIKKVLKINIKPMASRRKGSRQEGQDEATFLKVFKRAKKKLLILCSLELFQTPITFFFNEFSDYLQK